MKLLHTSDWHIGQQLYGYDRTEEHLDFFRQLKDISLAHRPDALLVSGDIFDVSSPSSASLKIFTDNLLALHEALPEMTIIIISGNHDSASRIDVNRNLWKAAGMHVIGTVRKEQRHYNFTENVIPIRDKGYVVAVPFVNRAFLNYENKETPAEEQFFMEAWDAVASVNHDNLPVALMAHLTVAGCNTAGHRVTIGDVEGVEAEVFRNRFDYIALGHIHNAQDMAENGRIRYSGAPVAMSFDENRQHSVTLAAVEKGMPVATEEIEITPLRRLVTYPTQPVEFKKAIRQLSKFDATDECYIRLNVAQEEDLPSDCEETAAAVCVGKACRFCTIKYQRAINEDAQPRLSSDLSLHEFIQLNPRDVAADLLASRGYSEALSSEYLELIKEIEDELSISESQ